MTAKKRTIPETATTSATSSDQRKAARTKPAAGTHKTAARRTAAGSARTSPPAAPQSDPSANHHEIAREAYALWLERGGQHGHDQEDWLRAIEIVKSRLAV